MIVRAPRTKKENLFEEVYKRVWQPDILLTLKKQSGQFRQQFLERRAVDEGKKGRMVKRMSKNFAIESVKRSFANKRNYLSGKILRSKFHSKTFISCRVAPQEMRFRKRMSFSSGGMKPKSNGKKLIPSTAPDSVVLKLRPYLAKQQGTCKSLQKPEPARRALEVWTNAAWEWVDAPPDTLTKE